jgi:two-component system LytT family response regulator
MNKIKAVLVDDEQNNIDNLELAILSLSDKFEIVAKISNSEEAIKYLENNEIDILFLDIVMPKYNGFELIDKLKVWTFDLVFVTAFENYAATAFKYSALDYLVKPIDDDELKTLLLRVEENFEKFNESILLDKPDKEPKLLIRSAEEMKLVKISDIAYIKAHGAYSHIHFLDFKEMISGKHLKIYTTLLEDFHFIRTHHGTLVNVKAIDAILSNKNLIVLENGEELSISMRKKKQLVDYLEQVFISK